MTSIIAYLHQALGAVLDIALYPLRNFSPIWGLLFVSALSGIVFLLLFAKCSNQKQLKETKRRISANLFEAILFRHDVFLSLRAQGRMFAQGFRYLSLTVPPLVVLFVPCIFLLAQLHERYGIRPLGSGEQGVVRVELQDPKQLFDLSLQGGPGIAITPPVRIADPPQIFWRVDVPADTGSSRSTEQLSFKLKTGSESFESPIALTAQESRLIRPEVSDTWWRYLLSPGERLPSAFAGVIQSLSISYPERRYRIFGGDVNWLIVFAVVSILSGLVGSKVFKIEI